MPLLSDPSLSVPPPQTRRSPPPITNRLRDLMLHVPWYSIEGRQRLARDCGVAQSTISRLAANLSSPSYYLARRVSDALEKRLGLPLDMRDVFSTDGTYPTPRVCDLTPDCRGCFPPEAYTDASDLKPEYASLQPGEWCTYPTPYDTTGTQSSRLPVTSHP